MPANITQTLTDNLQHFRRHPVIDLQVGRSFHSDVNAIKGFHLIGLLLQRGGIDGLLCVALSFVASKGTGVMAQVFNRLTRHHAQFVDVI